MKFMEENKIPNLAQWIPVYGICRALKDLSNDKPSLADYSNPLISVVSSLYHGTVIGMIGIPLVLGLEKILR